VCAAGEGVPLDAAEVLRTVLGVLGGSGGGSARMAQGGVPAGVPAADVAEAARRLVAERLRS
jgi:hypothetical protein